MISFSKASCAVSIATFAVFTIAGVQAYVPADVCSMNVILQYWDTNTNSASGSPITFPIENGAGDKDSINTDGMTVAELQLQPGDVTIQVQGNLCSEHADYPAVAWDTGVPDASSAQTISGLSPVTQITLVALDQEARSTRDLTVDYNPIITSVAVSPAIGSYNGASVFTFQAVDPASGDFITEYHLESIGDNLLQSGQFAPTLTNQNDENFDAQKCQSNDLAVCDIEYQPALPDAGNFEWRLTVEDNNANTDVVTGYFAVNAAGTLEMTINNWHVPVVDSVSSEDDNLTPTSEIQFGRSGILTFTVTDPDITNGLNDNLTLAVTNVVTLQSLAEGSQSNIPCSSADISIAQVSENQDTVTFTATWTPWAGNTDTAADYGETWCEFEFEVTDSATDTPLKSNKIEYTMAAIGTRITAGVAEQLPHFQVMFISDTAPVELDVVTVSVTFEDPDSLTTFSVADYGVLDSVTWAEEQGGSDSESGIDSSSGAVTRVLLMTMAADASTAADKRVILTITDEDDNSLFDARTITFAPVSDSVSRNRRFASPLDATALSAPVSRRDNMRQRRGVDWNTAQMSITLDGLKMAIETRHVQGKELTDVKQGNDVTVDSDDSVSTGAMKKATYGAIAGCAVLAVVLVGVVLRTKQITIRREADDAKLEEGKSIEKLEFDENPSGMNALALQLTAPGAEVTDI